MYPPRSFPMHLIQLWYNIKTQQLTLVHSIDLIQSSLVIHALMCTCGDLYAVLSHVQSCATTTLKIFNCTITIRLHRGPHTYNPVQQPHSRYSTVLSPKGCLMSPSYNHTLPLPQTINLFSKSVTVISQILHKFYINHEVYIEIDFSSA